MRLFDQNEAPLKTTQGFNNTSKQYQHINSLDICKQFEAQGFEYLGTSSASVRDPLKQGFQKHLMAFTRDDLVLSSGERMQVLCLNSHDASNALRLNLGVFRAACANGLVSGSSVHESRIIHKGDIIDQIKEQVNYIIGQAPKLKEQVEAMKSLELEYSQADYLIKSGADIRLEGIDGLHSIALNSIDRVRRKEDKGQDLWTVFNRVQESVIKGGIQYQIETTKKCPYTNGDITAIVNRSTREIKESKRVIETNRALWSKAVELVS